MVLAATCHRPRDFWLRAQRAQHARALTTCFRVSLVRSKQPRSMLQPDDPEEKASKSNREDLCRNLQRLELEFHKFLVVSG